MKKHLAPLVLFVFLIPVVAGAYLFVEPASEGADIIRDNATLVFDANGTPFLDTNGSCQIVSTNNNQGNRNARCEGQLPAGAVFPTRAIRWNYANTGFTCLGSTHWQQVVTPSGRAVDTCHAP